MEDLTKHQLILLTLLVSFVTSIATGIITFSLLQEAPVEVTQTINRVVERTIETVTPAPGSKEVVREVQVVSEEDLVLESIDKASKSLVRIKTLGFDGSEILAGFGVVVKDGIIATNAAGIRAGSGYKAVFSDGKSYNTAKSWEQGGFVFFNIGIPSNEKYSFSPAVLGDSDGLKLGQTVIALGGKTTNSAFTGRITQKEVTDKNILVLISTDVATSKSQSGGPLLNLSGEIVGFQASVAEGDANLFYVPIDDMKDLLNQALSELTK